MMRQPSWQLFQPMEHPQPCVLNLFDKSEPRSADTSCEGASSGLCSGTVCELVQNRSATTDAFGFGGGKRARDQRERKFLRDLLKPLQLRCRKFLAR
eukprot:4620077-Amphidinium_carterae.1